MAIEQGVEQLKDTRAGTEGCVTMRGRGGEKRGDSCLEQDKLRRTKLGDFHVATSARCIIRKPAHSFDRVMRRAASLSSAALEDKYCT